MFYFWLILTGLISGIIAGMGMGGGTLLIPVLTLIFGFDQKIAQSINLLVFIPGAIASLIVHIKNKLLKYKVAIPIIISGVISSVLSAIFAMKLESQTLKFCFAIFLIVVGVYQLITAICFIFKNKKKIPVGAAK